MQAHARPNLRLVPRESKVDPVLKDDSPASVPSPHPFSLLPDAELVGLAIQGNRNAQEWLYRRHAAYAIHLAARIEGSARNADDVVHDAFIAAFLRLRELKDPAAFRSWLGSIVVHNVRSVMRRARFLKTIGIDGEGEPVELDSLASPDASPFVRAQIAQIYALLQTQPVDNRIAWILREVEGHDLESVARLSGSSLISAKRRIARVQKFLDECFVNSENSYNPDVGEITQ